MPRALYLHVPFCPKICPYCDFHKMRRHDGLVEAYLDRIEGEIEDAARLHPGPLDTVYLGGGTPSELTDGELERLLGALDRAWGLPAALETTLEADPLTFDRQRLRHFRSLGISRLSIGLQSTQDPVLRRLGRRHNGRQGLEAVIMALEEGFAVSADLITAVEGQDAGRDLRELASSGVRHVSVYTLTVEPFTPFALRGVRVDEERAADDYELAESILGEYGLERYEVSSHAVPGHESKHNQVYWHGAHYLGIGPSAAAFLPTDGAPGVRRTNPQMKGWLRGDPPIEERSDPLTYTLERLMTGLRTRAGVDPADVVARGGVDPTVRFAETIEPLERLGLLELASGRLRATSAGLMRLDSLLRRFFAAAA